jgi:acetylornithine deacetylase/succinyl-diaminopimelate desuccinylase-like protein
MTSAGLVSSIRMERVAEDIWTLVNIPSPTGCEQKAAQAYAEMLRASGAEVEPDAPDPQRPFVVARLKGNRPGRRLLLAGHLDHIAVPHAAPSRDASTITGRGSADMKSGLAAVVEILRLLNAAGRDFPGEIMVAAYGMHEAPIGDSSTLTHLIRRGIACDAAIVMESDHSCRDKAVVAGAGQCIWNVILRRSEAASHELNRSPEADHLLECALRAAASLRAQDQLLRQSTAGHSLLRPESLFIGQMHYGDFYNRAPDVCTLQGTRRWHPGRSFDSVQKEMRELLSALPAFPGVAVQGDLRLTGDAYQVSPDESIVRALRLAWQTVTGTVMPLAGTSVVTDANRLVPLARIPTVLIGFDNEYAHADHESVRIERLLTPCRAALLTVLSYLESGERK